MSFFRVLNEILDSYVDVADFHILTNIVIDPLRAPGSGPSQNFGYEVQKISQKFG